MGSKFSTFRICRNFRFIRRKNFKFFVAHIFSFLLESFSMNSKRHSHIGTGRLCQRTFRIKFASLLEIQHNLTQNACREHATVELCFHGEARNS
jgi:hypothetical protein